MRRAGATAVAGLWLAVLAAVVAPAQAPYAWTLPAGFPAPPVPGDNPMSEAKVALGRYLFYDTRLSGNGTQSCGSCHEQARAFTDGRARSVGSTGQVHPRGSMSLVNVAYAQALTWADPALTRLEEQALVPMYGDHPIELGLDRGDAWVRRLAGDDTYAPLFAAAFPGEPAPVTRDNVTRALATFERAIVSARSPYDRYHFDRDDTAIPESARRGEVLFHSRPLSCFTCHGGVHFSGAMGSAPRPRPIELHDAGQGGFKAPTLRNIAVTAPYMHDGSLATLDAVIDDYAAGRRRTADGRNPGFPLTAGQRADLVAFLTSLTDDALLRDPRFANPWTARRGR